MIFETYRAGMNLVCLRQSKSWKPGTISGKKTWEAAPLPSTGAAIVSARSLCTTKWAVQTDKKRIIVSKQLPFLFGRLCTDSSKGQRSKAERCTKIETHWISFPFVSLHWLHHVFKNHLQVSDCILFGSHLRSQEWTPNEKSRFGFSTITERRHEQFSFETIFEDSCNTKTSTPLAKPRGGPCAARLLESVFFFSKCLKILGFFDRQSQLLPEKSNIWFQLSFSGWSIECFNLSCWLPLTCRECHKQGRHWEPGKMDPESSWICSIFCWQVRFVMVIPENFPNISPIASSYPGHWVGRGYWSEA